MIKGSVKTHPVLTTETLLVSCDSSLTHSFTVNLFSAELFLMHPNWGTTHYMCAPYVIYHIYFHRFSHNADSQQGFIHLIYDIITIWPHWTAVSVNLIRGCLRLNTHTHTVTHSIYNATLTSFIWYTGKPWWRASFCILKRPCSSSAALLFTWPTGASFSLTRVHVNTNVSNIRAAEHSHSSNIYLHMMDVSPQHKYKYTQGHFWWGHNNTIYRSLHLTQNQNTTTKESDSWWLCWVIKWHEEAVTIYTLTVLCYLGLLFAV